MTSSIDQDRNKSNEILRNGPDGHSILVPIVTNDPTEIVFVAGVLLEPSSTSERKAVLGSPGRQWSWRTTSSASKPGSALAVQRTSNPNAPFDETWEALYLAEDSSACIVTLEVGISTVFDFPFPAFQGDSASSLQALWHTHLSDSSLQDASLNYDSRSGAAAAESLMAGIDTNAFATDGVAAAMPAAGAAAAAAMHHHATSKLASGFHMHSTICSRRVSAGAPTQPSQSSSAGGAGLTSEALRIEHATASACGDCCSNISTFIPWHKVDVFITFFQLLGLILASGASRASHIASGAFAKISAFFALELESVAQAITIQAELGIALGLASLVLLGYIWLISSLSWLQADEVRQGREAKTWDQLHKSKSRTVWILTQLLRVATAAYIPVSRSILQLLMCTPDVGKRLADAGAGVQCTAAKNDPSALTCDCSGMAGYGFLVTFCGVVFVFFTFGLPVKLYQIIQASKPVGSRENPTKRFDDNGELVAYTDAMYQEDLLNDPRQTKSPIQPLYAPYSRNGAFWGVAGLLMKFTVVGATVLLSRSHDAQTAVNLVAVGFMLAVNFVVHPYVRPSSELMDRLGKSCLVVVSCLGLAASQGRFSYSQATKYINIASGINTLLIVILLLWSLPIVRRTGQFILGFLEFESVAVGSKGRLGDTLVSQDGTVLVDLKREIKLRVWQPVWRSIMTSTETGSDIAARFNQQVQVAHDAGRQRILEHFWFAKEHASDREFAMQELDGVDVFWDGAAGAQTGSCFGKATVVAYPFHVTVAFDQDDHVAFIWAKDLHRFVCLNKDATVQRRRARRQRLRGVALSRETLRLDHYEQRSYHLQDGTEKVKDSSGNEYTRPVYVNVTVTIHFKNCNVLIGAADAREMARGYELSVAFKDGTGSCVLPRTKRTERFSGVATSLTAQDLGFSSKFDVIGAKAKEMLTRAENMPKLSAGRERWMSVARAYRKKAMQTARAQEVTLSSAFWLHVYDNPCLDQGGVKAYLQLWESNPQMAPEVLLKKHAISVQVAVDRTQALLSHPCAALWYCFWDSLWNCNRGLEVIEKNAALLDSARSSALAHTPLSRAELEEKLQGTDLIGACNRFLSPGMLERLYAAQKRLRQLYEQNPKQAWEAQLPQQKRARKGGPSGGNSGPSGGNSERSPLLGTSTARGLPGSAVTGSGGAAYGAAAPLLGTKA